MMMKELTKAEEEIMQYLWEMEQVFVKDIIARMPSPKPAYTTVSTIIRILEKKGFVGHKAYGKTHEYYPLISKKEYTRNFMKRFMNNYFSNSFKEMVSFFAKEDKLSVSDLDELMKEVRKEIEEGSHDG
ncbi:MAG: BlaI/MecI/CopY family transcriptional regulator [Chlorobi bacterium]|nr:BlaI/MecI/CopY family transcriptional regulator [Chlorobiota bacterium]